MYVYAIIIRYLEEASCASVCVATCKLPTQQFFNEDMSVPMRMLPNYETYEVAKGIRKRTHKKENVRC